MVKIDMHILHKEHIANAIYDYLLENCNKLPISQQSDSGMEDIRNIISGVLYDLQTKGAVMEFRKLGIKHTKELKDIDFSYTGIGTYCKVYKKRLEKG
jgi:hypothetical protein